MKATIRILFISLFLSVLAAMPPEGRCEDDACAVLSGSAASDEQLAECRERLAKVENTNLWDETGKIIEFEELGDILEKKLDGYSVEDSKRKKYLKQFLPEVGARVSNLESDKNKHWIDEYLVRMQDYIDARSRHQTIIDEKSQLNSILGTLLREKRRLHSLTKVYLQNMAGVPTTYLVVGRDIFDIDRNESGVELFNRIVRNAIPFVRDNTSTTLIFSRTELDAARIVKDVIRALEGVRVEPYGKDPKTFKADHLRYLLQKFRCFPSYTIEEDAQGDKAPSSPKGKTRAEPGQGPMYWIIQQPDIGDELSEEMFPSKLVLEEYRAKLKAEIAKRFNELHEEDVKSIRQVKGFIEKYEEARETIIRKQEELGREVWALEENLAKSILKKHHDFNVRENLLEPTRKILEIDVPDISDGDKIKDRVIGWLNKVTTRFKEDEESARVDVENWLKHRRIIISTTTSEIIGDREKPLEVAKGLFKEALETLEMRNRHLVKYEESIVKEGILSEYMHEEYYVFGHPVRYLLFPPIYSSSRGGDGSVESISLFLALEVEYSVREGPSPATLAASEGKAGKEVKKKKFIFEMEDGSAWFIEEEECYPIDEAKVILPEGFILPDLEQLASLKTFLGSSRAKSIENRFPHLSRNDVEFWTSERSSTTDDAYTYCLSTGAKNTHSDSFCGYLVGVKVTP